MHDINNWCARLWHYGMPSNPLFGCFVAQSSETIQLLPGAHLVDEIQRYRDRYMSGDYGESANLTGVDWRAQHRYRDADMQVQYSHRISLSKGDVVIWNTRVPYALLPGTLGSTGHAALMCFASFRPADGSQEEQDFRRNIARSLLTVTPPTWLGNGLPVMRSSASQAEAEAGVPPARVSPLGMKLFGISGWATGK